MCACKYIMYKNFVSSAFKYYKTIFKKLTWVPVNKLCMEILYKVF